MRSTMLLLVLLTVCVSSAPATAGTTLSRPVTFGSPDQPWGVRRPVTDADRAAIQKYRSGAAAPIYSTTFTDPVEFQSNWRIVEDDSHDSTKFLSCRTAGSVEISPAGLRLKTLVVTGHFNHWSTGYIASKAQYTYGFFEATMKTGDISGMNNAFWMTTTDHFEIDAAEARYPDYAHLGLQWWPTSQGEKHAGVGFGAYFTDNLFSGYHDFGVLRTPTDIVFEVDGEPIAALTTHNSVVGPASLLLSSALGSWAGKLPEHPEGHDMFVRSLRVYAL